MRENKRFSLKQYTNRMIYVLRGFLARERAKRLHEPERRATDPLSWVNQDPAGAILSPMNVEEIGEAIAKLPPDQLARFRRWFAAFEAGRADHAEELDSAAIKLGRLAGRAFAQLKKRTKEP